MERPTYFCLGLGMNLNTVELFMLNVLVSACFQNSEKEAFDDWADNLQTLG